MLRSQATWSRKQLANFLRPTIATRLAVLTLLVLLILGAVSLVITYAQKRQPVTRLLPAAEIVDTAVQPRYVFSIYDVNEPFGVATSPDGQMVYVTELAGERQLKVFDRTGIRIFSGSPPGSVAPGRAPLYISVNQEGLVFVADRARHELNVYSRDGKYLRRFEPKLDPNADGNFVWNPMGSTFDKDGNLYVTDMTEGQHRVLIFNPDGQLIRQFGTEGTGPGEFSFPQGVAVSEDGTIFVANGNLGRVDVFDQDGTFEGAIGQGTGPGSIGLPRGLAIDGDRLYIVDNSGHGVVAYRISESKPFHLFSLGSQGDGNGEFLFPNGIAIDRTGRIYVADRNNNRIEVWSY